MSLPPADSRRRARELLLGLQDTICAGLEHLDGEGRFQEESWERPEGGGGRSRVMKAGRVLEQGGVNFSEVEGDRLPPSILSQRPEAEGQRWFAVGTSMVLHPRNPYVPTVHLNYRYFEAGPVWWFGGGADLTPYYPFLEDARHFHRTLKQACDSVDPAYYTVFKPWCDEYFSCATAMRPGASAAFFTTTRTLAGCSTRARIPGVRRPPPALASVRSARTGRSCLPWPRPAATPSCPVMSRSSSDASQWPGRSGSANSSSTAGAAMWNSIWSSTAARSSACRPTVAPNRS